jgi:molybdenum cofactor biosynthesis enzyme
MSVQFNISNAEAVDSSASCKELDGLPLGNELLSRSADASATVIRMAPEIWRFIKDGNVNNGEAMMLAPIAGVNERASRFSRRPSRLIAASPSALTLNPISKVCAAHAA